MRLYPIASALSATILLFACTERPPQTPAQQATTKAMFDYVMERVPAYVDERNAKAMAACIKWDPAGDKHNILSAPWYRTAQTSDGLFTANQFIVSAMHTCEEQRREQSQDCTCQEFAMNDTNVLIVP